MQGRQSAPEASSDAIRPHMVRRHLWAVLGTLLVLAGTLTSVFAALDFAHSQADRSRKDFVASSAEIATTLQLAIQHEQDLVVDAGAVFVRDPGTTQTEFLQWADSIGALTRYPELQGMSELELVPASQLAAFEAKETADPPGPLGANGKYQLLPGGSRPYYCLETVQLSRYKNLELPAGIDYCKTSIGANFLKARDSGVSMYIPYKTGNKEELGLGTAIYANGTVPKTVQERRAELVGFTGVEVLPEVLLATALEDHPKTAVQFHYGAGTSKVTFTEGAAPAHPQSTIIGLHNGWTVETFAAAPRTGVFANGDALAILLGGVALSFLLSTLIYVLGTGRARAREKLEISTRQLRFQALHDPLTGLPNRALIIDRIEQLLARSRRNGTPLAAMFLDIDEFKDINDTLGHSAGDQLLVQLADRLSGALREGDTVGRLGGDEFVILVEGTTLDAGAPVVADRILKILRPPFAIEASNVPLSVSASIGVAIGDRATPDDLLRDADIALYQAKAAGKGRAVIFAQTMEAVVTDRRHYAEELRDAFRAHEFFLLYQPTIDLQSNTFSGVESLLRWQHPQRGVVPPDEFIQTMETSGLIVPVGSWVLRESCRQGAIWHAHGHRFSVSVNVSGQQLEQDRIVDDVRLALAESGFLPGKLVLEISESTLMKNKAETTSRLDQLKALGVRIAVDDFGTGYSSLSYLRSLPIDELKIDRSFVSGITDSTESAALVHTLIQLGKALKLETTAKGIEDDDQRLCLKAEDVTTGQGFLFSRPLDATQVDLFSGTVSEPVDMVTAQARPTPAAHST